MGSHDPSRTQLMAKRKVESQIGNLIPDRNYVQVACDTPLESSRRGLQLCFIPHPDRRFVEEVIVPQSRESSNLGDFEIPTWESRDKKSFG